MKKPCYCMYIHLKPPVAIYGILSIVLHLVYTNFAVIDCLQQYYLQDTWKVSISGVKSELRS
jgi:hypothetical protein